MRSPYCVPLMVLGLILCAANNNNEMEKNEYTDLIKKVSVPELRFSTKISFSKEISMKYKDLIRKTFPLDSGDYSIRNVKTYELLRKSNAVSVTLPDDYEIVQSVREMIEVVGGLPSHAPNVHFWPEFEEVINVQFIRREHGDDSSAKVFPWLPLPKLWKYFKVNEVAESVRADFPGYWHMHLIIQFLSGGMMIDNSIIPKRSENQFLHKQVMLADINTWAVATVSSINFGAKYYVGRARPEEVAWNIATKDTLIDATPPHIVKKINDMNLKTMEEFTAYTEGSPPHPSWPAMHSAASALSMWLPVVTRLKRTQKEESKIMDLAISMGRTIAGVHYISDNIAGLKMGQEIVARELPKFLATRYGADPIKVKRRVESLRFDWEKEASRLLNGYPNKK